MQALKCPTLVLYGKNFIDGKHRATRRRGARTRGSKRSRANAIA